MSHIDDLIAEHCPDGVEHKFLGEVGEFIRGNGLQKKDLFDEGVPAIHYGQIHTRYGVWTDQTVSFTSAEIASKLRHARYGDLLIATTSEDDEAVAKSTAWLGRSEVVLSGDAYIYRHSLDPRYVAYFFQSEHFQGQKQRHVSGTKVRRISGASLSKILIPVPPLEVQRAIVEVLDTFSKLEAELEAELEGRRLQYRHYRDLLFDFHEASKVPYLALNAVGSFTRGRRFTKNDIVESGIPSIHYGEIYTSYGVAASEALRELRSEMRPQLRFAQQNDVIFAGVGETVEDVGKAVAWLGNVPVAVHDDTFFFTSALNPLYVAHFAQTTSFNDQKAAHVARGKVKRLSASGLGAIQIPVPSVGEQNRIVAILNKFDALVNDLSVGLPSELAARRQQYEYYRDKLLTFKELSQESA
ncbi:restriction endonuclease subunit S [Timonella senegalensis]|uniref:restriction endonuclease subunit S n=1 Tax=Timonella senegalensis TaxID=1465825 RepID=UPI0028A9431C|nr:restriction endonuclease subunit S [Timonella senegalensis]